MKRLALSSLATSAMFATTPGTSCDPTCVDGADCLCDSWASDPRQVLCEDFEAIVLCDVRGAPPNGPTGPGSGATACTPGNQQANCANNDSSPLYGPWYSKRQDQPGGRGSGSYWACTWTRDSGTNLFPFARMSLFTTSQAECEAARANIVWNLNSIAESECTTGAFRYRPSPAIYDRATDFPLGEWHCKRAMIRGLGTSSVSVEIWIDNERIIDFENFDGSKMRGPIADFTWSRYANANDSSQPGTPPTSRTTYRYEDNVYIRGWNSQSECDSDGVECRPLLCSQIGLAP